MTLVKVAAATFGLSFAIFNWLQQMNDFFVLLQWSAVVALLLIDFALGVWGWQIRDRMPKTSKDETGEVILLRAKQPLNSLVAARTAALALAASRTGSVLVGGYLGIALVGFFNWQIVAAQSLAWNATATALAAVGLVLVGLWLERICRLPNPRP